MMQLMDYHSHHWRCGHAKGDIEDYIKAAIDAGLAEIGIALEGTRKGEVVRDARANRFQARPSGRALLSILF